MNESEINELVAEAFVLGYGITIQSITGESASQRKWSEQMKLLHEVADGETTLVDNPAETWGRVPELQGADSAEFIARFTRDQIQGQMRVAKRVVAGMGSTPA